jgi:hypothetical protein
MDADGIDIIALDWHSCDHLRHLCRRAERRKEAREDELPTDQRGELRRGEVHQVGLYYASAANIREKVMNVY